MGREHSRKKSAEWKHRRRTRAVGLGAYERCATLGLFGHGGVVGVSNAAGLREACTAVNGFLRSRFSSGTWTFIAVLFNPRMGLHCDGRALESRARSGTVHGRAGVDRRRRRGLDGLAGRQEGRWLDTHDKPVSFARRYHMVEPHEGSMWALAAYVPQAYARATKQHRQTLREAGFPLPE